MRYLKGTKSFGIHYARSRVGKLKGTADASWSVTADAKSFSGYVVQLGGNLVTWKCKKQDVVAMSSCEAETLAIVSLVKELKWLQGLIAELKEPDCLQYPVKLYTDSQSAMGVITNSNTHYRTKHFRRTFAFVRDEVERGNIVLEYVASECNVADALTKNVHGPQLSSTLRELYIGPMNERSGI